jgi:hypothetical protein
MIQRLRLLRIFLIAACVSAAVVVIKYSLHVLGLEIIEQSSLHNSVAAGVFFVLGFILSATIADYKESEKIPASFSSVVDNFHDDARTIHVSHPGFDLDGLREQLYGIAKSFASEVRNKSHGTRDYIHGLSPYFVEMEQAGVPANFIVKLKQQQVQLLNHVSRVVYIQRITFIPSARILARSIVALLITMFLFTNVDPYFGSLAIVGLISFILVYMLVLIRTISTPFQEEGRTRDDVSMFLISDVMRRLSSERDTAPAARGSIA